MRHLITLILAALTFNFGWGQELRPTPTMWLPENMPNPQINPKGCGLGFTEGYVCDPNSILTRNERETLDWFLHGLANYSNLNNCPCSQYHCDTFNGPRFYKVAVALVPKLRLPINTNGEQMTVLDQAQVFAYRLVSKLWNMGSCGENIVILYARDDQALVTMTGQTAGEKLDAESRGIIHRMVGDLFLSGRINDGLLRMVHEIGLVLKNERYYKTQMLPHMSGSGFRLSPWSLHFLLLLLPSLIFTSFLRPS